MAFKKEKLFWISGENFSRDYGVDFCCGPCDKKGFYIEEHPDDSDKREAKYASLRVALKELFSDRKAEIECSELRSVVYPNEDETLYELAQVIHDRLNSMSTHDGKMSDDAWCVS